MEGNDHIPPNVPFEGEKKIVVVGQYGCGKSSLIASFVLEGTVDMTEALPEDIRKTISFGRERVTVILSEVQSRPQHPLERMMEYIGANAVLVCFAFNDAKSIRSIPRWIDESIQYCRPTDLFVVGCKLDLKHKTSVSVREWMPIERAILPYKYLECSAKTGEGVSHLVRMVGNMLLSGQQSGHSSAQR